MQSAMSVTKSNELTYMAMAIKDVLVSTIQKAQTLINTPNSTSRDVTNFQFAFDNMRILTTFQLFESVALPSNTNISFYAT